MSKKTNKVKSAEKELIYSDKKLKVYSDADAAAESETKYVLEQSPLERIKETVKLILRIYPKIKQNSNKLYIDKS